MRVRNILVWALHIPLYAFIASTLWHSLLGFISFQLSRTVATFCQAPGLGYVCYLASWNHAPDAGENRGTHALDLEFEGLHQLLQATAHISPNLNHDLISARIAVEDLIIVVKSGELDCRQQLVEQLKLFGVEAKATAREMERFMIKVNMAAERALATNEQTLASLRRQKEVGLMTFNVCKMTGNTLWLEACQLPQQLEYMFTKTLNTFEVSTTALLRMSEDLNGAFTRLDERLEVIRDIAAGEGRGVLNEQIDILESIWTSIGANRKAISRLRTQANALKLVIGYHTTAHRYVAGAHRELTSMEAALEDLRTLTVESILDGGHMPMEVLIETVSRGIGKLKQENRAERVHRVDGAGLQCEPRSLEMFDMQ